MHAWKIDQMNLLVWKSDQLLSLYIAGNRFLKRTLTLDRFLKHALSFDRFFFGGIDMVDRDQTRQVVVIPRAFKDTNILVNFEFRNSLP